MHTTPELLFLVGSSGLGLALVLALIADFLEACRMGRPPAVSGEEALESQRWVERILARAAESG